ncbi:unnamed protein product [Prunus armeniaca]
MKIWNEWNLRGCIILSLALQVFLFFCAPLRQKCRSKLIVVLIWFAYLLFDWVAAVAIGVITKSQGDPYDSGKNKDLLAFWAPFLLVHLGGPDTITSFALEDNEFWLRHLIQLILQVLAAAYSFYMTLFENKLWFPTVLVFVVGTIKFGERTCALYLYLASLDHFGETVLPEPEPGPDYEEAVEIYSTMRSVEVPTQVELPIRPMHIGNYKNPKFTVEGVLKESLDDVQLLQEAYRFFGSFKGLIVGFLLSSKVQERSREFFLKRTHVSAFQLIEYELSFMYEVLHTKVVVAHHKVGYILRLLTFCSTIGALMLFALVGKHKFDKFDIALTYALLIGAIILDTLSVLNLICSDWTVIAFNNIWSRSYIGAVILKPKRGRWSGSVSKYNMISNFLDEHPEWVYTFAEAVTEDVKKFLFKQLRIKSLEANNRRAAMEASSQRESVLLWHIATELYFAKKKHNADKERREICKLLSDYMFYLLVVMQHNMMAPFLGNWHIVFQDTRAEAKRFFFKHKITDHGKACEKINAVEAKFRSAAVKDKSKSVLFDACFLVKQLEEVEADPWKLMSPVWVELLSYASIKCRPIVHAHQPSRGGELLAFTWLLMNHLGLGTQFYELENQAGTKMVAVK